MYPDLGIALIERQELKPFRLTVLNDLTLAEDRVLGWMIIGLTQQFFTSAVDSNPAPIIQEPMMRSHLSGPWLKIQSLYNIRQTTPHQGW